MAKTAIEILEPRSLLSGAGTDAAVTEDKLIIHADIQAIHFDMQHLRQVTRADSAIARLTTTADRNRIHDDLHQLKVDERRDPQNAGVDLITLRSDETLLRTDLLNSVITARADRKVVLTQIATDASVLRGDRLQLRIDRRS